MKNAMAQGVLDRGKAANLKMYHLHHNIESDICLVMELNDDDDDGRY